MPDLMLVRESDYGLAETAIISANWVSPSSSDALARRSLVASTVEQPIITQRRVILRKRESIWSVEIQGQPQLPLPLQRSVEAVADLLGLPAGWNSYAAKPIDRQGAVQAIKFIAEFLKANTPLPLVVPTVRGGIQLEWHTRGVDLEVYIDPSKPISFFAEQAGSGMGSDLPLQEHEYELRSWLERLSGK